MGGELSGAHPWVDFDTHQPARGLYGLFFADRGRQSTQRAARSRFSERGGENGR